jgi:hypothetical protein
MQYENSKTYKAITTAKALRDMANVLEGEGSKKKAELFREMAECSWEGLAALYDAIKGHNDA